MTTMNATSNVHVVRDAEGPHDDLFHFMRDDVVLGTVYWDAADCGPARTTGWFYVTTGDDIHRELPGAGPTDWEDAVRHGFRALLHSRTLGRRLTPEESRDMLFWSITNPDGTPCRPANSLTPVEIDLPVSPVDVKFPSTRE